MSALDRFVSKMSSVLIARRAIFSVFFAIVTALFAWNAANIKLDPGFLKLIPIKHPYMQTMMQYVKEFSGANMLLVNVRWKGEGEIYNKSYMKALQQATDDVFFIPGINRTKVSSLFTPSTYYIEITEYGFDGKPVVPAEFAGLPHQLAEVKKNVKHSGQIGLLVANDHKGALIRADLQEVDTGNPAEAEAFYRAVIMKLDDLRGHFENPKKYVYTLTEDFEPFKAGDKVWTGYTDYGWQTRFQKFYVTPPEAANPIGIPGSLLEVEVVDNPDYNPDVEINTIGFARLLGDVIAGLVGVFAFFLLAFVVTAILLRVYTGSNRITVAALVAALLPVVWLLGFLPMVGYGIDPMSILVPFLIFAIGVSHAVQMTSVWRLEVVDGKDSKEAAANAFDKLFVPGTIALVTDAMGFAVIMLIAIPIVHELGITTCVGTLMMIITNKFILPIILSHTTLEESSKEESARESALVKAFITFTTKCANPRFGIGVFLVSALTVTWLAYESRSVVVGDSGRGVPELHADARYNTDSNTIASTYDIGADVLTIIVEAPEFEGDSCLHYEVVDLIDRFELYMRGVDGVRSVTAVGGIGKLVIAAFNEGNPRWRALPRSQAGLSTGSRAFDPNLGLNTEGCRAIQIIIFTNDHDGTTIAHVTNEVKRFIADNPVEGVTMRLASGNVGVMVATNEAVAAAEVQMLVAIFSAIILFCLLSFRSFYATLCVVTPLISVAVLGNALLALFDIGLKVATLPVLALGVGIGVDYGLYLMERTQHYLEEGLSVEKAFENAMWERGTAAVFTAFTMGVGVGTWMLSALKFQADMGIVLASMFVVNMIGAVCLLPALAAWFYKRKEAAA